VPSAPSNKDYAPGFASAMMLKDLHLAEGASKQVSANTPMGSLATRLYEVMRDRGADGLDFSAVMKLINGTLET
jgi:3-hydroxyisobutyrate dehydrogenase